MLVTHVLILKTTTDLESQAQWQSLLKLLTTTIARPVYAGRQDEDSTKIWLLTGTPPPQSPPQPSRSALIPIIEWPTLTCWSSAPTLQTHLDTLLASHTHSLTIASSFAVALQSEDRSALAAPTTEISIGFVKAGSEAAIRLQQATAISAQKAAVRPGAPVGVVSGWTYDKELPSSRLNEGIEKEMGRGRGLVSLAGWESRAAHWAFAEGQVGMVDVRAAGAEGWEIAHVRFGKVEA